MTTLPDWLTKRLELTPHKTAIELKWGSATATQYMTWHYLHSFITHAIETLSFYNIKPGDRVAVLMDNSLSFVLAFHALIQLRAVVVPINIRLNASEIEWQLNDVKASLLLSDKSNLVLARKITESPPQLPVLDFTLRKDEATQTYTLDPYPMRFSLTHWPQLSGSTPIRLSTFSLNDTHSILYTSGTTGKPKGVMLTYGNHWWSAMGSALNLGMREDDKWLLVLPLFHVGGLSMLFKSVIYGNTLQLHERFEVEAVNHALDHDGITHVSLVATMLQRLLEARGDTPYPTTLRTVLLGGGPCPQPLLERCAKLGIPVVQTYGMTETASQSVTLAPQDALRKLGSAGKPLFPTELRIENEGQPVPPGEIGEILLRGPNVTAGYADRPEATATAIWDGWLYTGDLGYIDKEGYLYIVNRRTDLIISGGENIYPAEIEAVLLAHPAVAEAVVVGIEDEQWGQRVVAAVVATAGVSIKELKNFAAERLAKYKVPRTMKMVSELPRNAGGKVLRDRVRVLFEGDV